MGKQNLNSENYAGWGSNAHLKTFGFWNLLSNPTFNYMYGNFQENRYLINLLKSGKARSIIDVGCATGTTYRLLRNKCSDITFNYNGFDISKPAISYAKQAYNERLFHLVVEHDYQNLASEKKEILFSRDTIMHQENPFDFLETLINNATKYLILRLRTRDNGDTEWDFDKSSQMHYDEYWMPYIVINMQELVDFILGIRKAKSIEINRSYEILGGQNFRYLPKELYHSSSGGSETSICIEYDDRSTCRTKIAYTEKLEGQKFLRVNKHKTILLKIIDKIFYKNNDIVKSLNT